jgi:hypothetical protein
MSLFRFVMAHPKARVGEQVAPERRLRPAKIALAVTPEFRAASTEAATVGRLIGHVIYA